MPLDINSLKAQRRTMVILSYVLILHGKLKILLPLKISHAFSLSIRVTIVIQLEVRKPAGVQPHNYIHG